jgi:hypothetical protein
MAAEFVSMQIAVRANPSDAVCSIHGCLDTAAIFMIGLIPANDVVEGAMNIVGLSGAVGLLLGLCLQGGAAHAQLARTFVSAEFGNDANDCGRLTPCRSFARAHNQTLDQGEITVLDPGGYGAVTITKSISIINDGVGEAGTLVSGGFTGITISAGVNDKVSLRGLTIKGIGFGGGTGIVFNSGNSLTVESCAIRNLTGPFPTGHGIVFQPNASSSLAVSNTVITDNSNHGIIVSSTGAGTVAATLSRVELYHNGFAGLLVSSSPGSIKVTAADSVAANNNEGFTVLSIAGVPASLMLVRSVAANNLVGITANDNNATVRVGQTKVSGNVITSWRTVGAGILRSYGDNNIDGNGDGDPSPPTIPRK